MKDVCVISQLDFHGRLLCEVLGIGPEDFYSFKQVPPDNTYRLMILLGVYLTTPWEDAIARVKGSKWLCYWVGTDILFATQDPHRVARVQTDHTVHWTQRPTNKAELAEVGIDAKIVPLPVQTNRFRPVPLPDVHVVGNYQPKPGISPINFHPELTDLHAGNKRGVPTTEALRTGLQRKIKVLGE